MTTHPEPTGSLEAMPAETTPSALLAPSLRRLEQLARLKPDWDSYGALPPFGSAVAQARRLLETVAGQFGAEISEGAAPFAIAPLAVGGIQLQWRGPSGEIEVEVSPDGEFGYLLIEAEGTNRSFQEGDHVGSFDLLALVTKVLSPRSDI
ncbi:MAG: hypothetical protein ACR2PL_05650 [Dehalococcoidia bacterium]